MGKLGDVILDARPGFACGDDVEDGIIHFRMNNVTREGTIDWSKIRRVPRERNRIEELYVQPGDLLFNSTSSPELVGKCTVFPGNSEPVTFSNHFHRLRPDHARADSRFIRRWITLQWSRGVFEGMCRQWVNQATVTKDSLLGLQIPLPPLAEQRRIADLLDRAEALRAKRRAAIAQLDSLTESHFLDLFGNPATNPKDWPHKTLFDLGKVVTGGTPPSVKPDMFDGPIPFITPGDLESDEPVKRSLTAAGAEESRTVRAGATLVCCIGATIGKMGVAPVRSAFNQQLNAVEWKDEINDLYGYATLRFFKPTIKSWGASTTLPILKKSSFEKIEIPVPPLPLQQEFARRFQATEKLRAAQTASLAELDELFASLQNRAFKGELCEANSSEFGQKPRARFGNNSPPRRPRQMTSTVSFIARCHLR